jgi:hypothetical protein
MTSSLSLPYLFAKKFSLLLEGDKLSYETLPDASTLLEITRKHGVCRLEKIAKTPLRKRMRIRDS